MSEHKKSWFKQFWPWFLIGLPLVAVVGSVNLLITALDNHPDMVVDDYYTKGKAINADLTLLKNAQARQISAQIVTTTDGMRISLAGTDDKTSILLSLHHATLAKRDITKMLTADANGDYLFQDDNDLTGKWNLRIEPFDKSWRLQKTVQLPRENIKL